MTQPNRLPEGGRIDRSRSLSFEFDGQRYSGHPGDTLASALLANGVMLLGRSFKYHRPRGLLAAVVNSWLSRFLPAGFYYKTFMWPERMWMTYEHVIRRAAGLGVAPTVPDPDRYEHRYDQPELLIVGAGPSGLAAALASLLGDTAEIDGQPALDWVAAVASELAANPDVRVLTRTTLTGYFDYNYLIATEHVTAHLGPQSSDALPRQRLWKLRARNVVLATGAIERPLVFADNDRPRLPDCDRCGSSGLRCYAGGLPHRCR